MRRILALSLVLTILFGMHISSVQAQNMNQKNVKIVYVYDALCGWCYGFSPVMNKVYKKYNNSVDFEVVSGGLMRGEKMGPIGEVAPFIKDGYKQVEETTGVEFGTEFLRNFEEGSMMFTSLPAAVAMSVFKLYQPEKAIEYASAIQYAIYFEGMPPEPYDGYAAVASTFGIDAEGFLKQMNKDMLQQQAYADFTIAEDLGITGFPAVVIQDGTRLYKVSNGYTSYDDIVASIDRVLDYIKSEAEHGDAFKEQ